MNLSRVIGPVLAGALLAAVSPAAVFVLNALLAMLAFVLILRWRYTPRAARCPASASSAPCAWASTTRCSRRG
jgi:MFS family permease